LTNTGTAVISYDQPKKSRSYVPSICKSDFRDSIYFCRVRNFAKKEMGADEYALIAWSVGQNKRLVESV